MGQMESNDRMEGKRHRGRPFTKTLLTGLTLLGIGIFLLVLASIMGQAEFHLLFFFPIITSTGAYGLIGSLALMAGVFVTFMGLFSIPPHSQTVNKWRKEPVEWGRGKPRSNFGGVILIGPVPIIFGSNPKTALLSAIAGLIMVILLFAVVLPFILGF